MKTVTHMGLIWKVISHTKSIFNPQQDHRSCHTISILGPYVAHIIKFGKGLYGTGVSPKIWKLKIFESKTFNQKFHWQNLNGTQLNFWECLTGIVFG